MGCDLPAQVQHFMLLFKSEQRLLLFSHKGDMEIS